MKKLIISIISILVLFGCAQEAIQCSTTCIGDGIATTATVCTDNTLMEVRQCNEPVFVKPEVGMKCFIHKSLDDAEDIEKVTILYLEDKDDGFWISGELQEKDLGRGVYTEDGLVGIIESGEGHERWCRNVGRY